MCFFSVSPSECLLVWACFQPQIFGWYAFDAHAMPLRVPTTSVQHYLNTMLPLKVVTVAAQPSTLVSCRISKPLLLPIRLQPDGRSSLVNGSASQSVRSAYTATSCRGIARRSVHAASAATGASLSPVFMGVAEKPSVSCVTSSNRTAAGSSCVADHARATSCLIWGCREAV